MASISKKLDKELTLLLIIIHLSCQWDSKKTELSTFTCRNNRLDIPSNMHSITILSPGYPEGYPANISCQATLAKHNDVGIYANCRGNFQLYQSTRNGECPEDYVQFGEGKYCGDVLRAVDGMYIGIPHKTGFAFRSISGRKGKFRCEIDRNNTWCARTFRLQHSHPITFTSEATPMLRVIVDCFYRFKITRPDLGFGLLCTSNFPKSNDCYGFFKVSSPQHDVEGACITDGIKLHLHSPLPNEITLRIFVMRPIWVPMKELYHCTVRLITKFEEKENKHYKASSVNVYPKQGNVTIFRKTPHYVGTRKPWVPYVEKDSSIIETHECNRYIEVGHSPVIKLSSPCKEVSKEIPDGVDCTISFANWNTRAITVHCASWNFQLMGRTKSGKCSKHEFQIGDHVFCDKDLEDVQAAFISLPDPERAITFQTHTSTKDHRGFTCAVMREEYDWCYQTQYVYPKHIAYIESTLIKNDTKLFMDCEAKLVVPERLVYNLRVHCKPLFAISESDPCMAKISVVSDVYTNISDVCIGQRFMMDFGAPVSSFSLKFKTEKPLWFRKNHQLFHCRAFFLDEKNQPMVSWEDYDRFDFDNKGRYLEWAQRGEKDGKLTKQRYCFCRVKQ